MNKEEFIGRYGAAAYGTMLQRNQDWNAQHPKNRNAIQKKWVAQHRDEVNRKRREWHAQHRDEVNAKRRRWYATNPDKVKAHNQEINRKGGKLYEKKLEYQHTGIPGERHSIRLKHGIKYHYIKQATPNSVLHHEWIPGTSKYRGVALVDKELHQRGIIKVIKLLEGKITLFLEKEVKNQGV